MKRATRFQLVSPNGSPQAEGAPAPPARDAAQPPAGSPAIGAAPGLPRVQKAGGFAKLHAAWEKERACASWLLAAKQSCRFPASTTSPATG